MLSGLLAPSIMVGLTQTVGWRNAFHLLAIPGLLVAVGLVFLMMADRPSANHRATPTGAKHVADILTALALGAIIAPALSDRFGRKPCAIVATLALSIGPLGLILAQHHIAFLALTFATSLLGGGALTLMVYVIPGESTPPNVVATLYAILLFVGEMTGGAIAPSLAGYLSDRFNVSAAMWMCSGFALTAFFAALTVQKVEHNPDAGVRTDQRHPIGAAFRD
jgi:MFS family permease